MRSCRPGRAGRCRASAASRLRQQQSAQHSRGRCLWLAPAWPDPPRPGPERLLPPTQCSVSACNEALKEAYMPFCHGCQCSAVTRMANGRNSVHQACMQLTAGSQQELCCPSLATALLQPELCMMGQINAGCTAALGPVQLTYGELSCPRFTLHAMSALLKPSEPVVAHQASTAASAAAHRAAPEIARACRTLQGPRRSSHSCVQRPALPLHCQPVGPNACAHSSES